jgi:two-component system, chemotaxis family, chemotaxis protein CheY
MLHCLVIDDSDIVRKYTRLIFESLNFRVSEADGAISALERLRWEIPDFILVDWRMPGENSIELISKIYEMTAHRRPHIMYVVSENDQPEIRRAMANGAGSFILKPFNRELIQMKFEEIRNAA